MTLLERIKKNHRVSKLPRAFIALCAELDKDHAEIIDQIKRQNRIASRSTTHLFKLETRGDAE